MHTPLRLTVIVVGMLGALLMAAGPAAAETPVTWVDPEPMSKLDALVLFGGSTLTLIVLLTLLGLLTARHNYVLPDPMTEIHVQPTVALEASSTH